MDETHLCVCCLRRPPDKGLTTLYANHDKMEIYSDMLQDCFNVQMVLDGWGSCGICLTCVGRLRDASDFKLQVQRCQAELRAQRCLAELCARIPARSHVKEEESDTELSAEHEDETGHEHVLEELPGPGLADGAGASDDEESTVRLELITIDEGELTAEPAVRAEVPAAAARDEERPQLDTASMSAEAAIVKLEPEPVPAGLGSIKAEPEWREEALCVKQEPSYSETTGEVLDVSEAPILAALLVGHVVKDELMLGPERLHRPCVGSTLQAPSDNSNDGFSCVKKEPIDEDPGFQDETCQADNSKVLLPSDLVYTEHICVKVEAEFIGPVKSEPTEETEGQCEKGTASRCGSETALQDTESERPVLSEVPDGAARAEDGSKTHKIHTEVKPFKCGNCDYKCRYKSSLQRHQIIHTGEKPFKCGSCDYKCGLKSMLQSHQKLHTGEKPFKCGRCNYKCRDKSSLKRHQIIHTGEKPYQCSYCDYKCSDKSALLRHQRLHSREMPFKCGYCDFKCTRNTQFQTHQRRHTGEKPFQCGYCDYKFTRKSHLQDHQKIHSGEKPFQCGNCDYKSSRKSDLKYHQRIHTGEKPLQCGYCDYKCSHNSTLRRHQRIHTGEEPFKCG